MKRIKTPTVLQMEGLECGAASLAMVLAYHGRKVPLEELRVECGVSRDGSKASNVLKAARKYGMEANGFRLEPEDLKTIDFPVIIFWNFNHFVVLEGFKNDKVYINDPASGPKVISYEEFDNAFTGVVLTFSPTDKFEKGGDSDSTVKSLLRRLDNAASPLVYIILAGLFLVVPGIVIPVFTRIFVDNVLVGRMLGWFRPLLVAMSITALIRFTLTWLQEHYLLKFETRLAISSSAKFLTHILSLPVEFFSQRMGGDLVSRIQLNDKVATLLSGTLSINALNLVMVFFYMIIMFYYDIVLTMTGIAVAMINLVALKFVSKKRALLNQKLQQEMGKLMGVSMSGLRMIETLKASGGESDFFAKWGGHEAKVTNANQELAIPTQLLGMVTPLLLAINNLVVLVVGGYRVMDGVLTMGMLVAFQSLMSSFLQPFNQLVQLGSTLQETTSDIKRLDDALKYKKAQGFNDISIDEFGSEKLEGHLELRNISFGYSKVEPPLITDFSVILRPGSRVAIVGGSGSGKSTVAKIASGLYAPWSGEVLYDGKLLHNIPEQVFFDSVAMVDQDIFMFEGSIKENLTMWDSSVPDEDVVFAAHDAHIHDEVASRRGGYESHVEEGGTNFSGGQRQRIEIARALLNIPNILIMDEATSALDAQTEMIVDGNIRRRGTTCLIVAHRLSTIRDCDEIIVLDKGKIVQRGTHETMKDVEGPYAELIKSY
ncbi:NHLP family bacteriocin export ABC transporter peptidase/permease/ATPase subunit [Desulforegula conservatrix]|uniref:NHLP family bacteriocin export ABC transporter peptidase/permease/ATPase subunit n=1 Tax=Desulforegula conservatrix TaxID=153026 RepID=UPI000A045EAD|nr:NHLP family bacteriocin export ABC transporter peptidase/permease/ATPase subunit [Desulforegula conservatrix]